MGSDIRRPFLDGSLGSPFDAHALQRRELAASQDVRSVVNGRILIGQPRLRHEQVAKQVTSIYLGLAEESWVRLSLDLG